MKEMIDFTRKNNPPVFVPVTFVLRAGATDRCLGAGAELAGDPGEPQWAEWAHFGVGACTSLARNPAAG